MAVMGVVSRLTSGFRPVVQFWSDSSICLCLPCSVWVSSVFQPVKKPFKKGMKSEASTPSVETRVKTNNWSATPGGPQKDICHA